MSLSPNDLRQVPVFQDLSQGELEWLLEHGQERYAQPGEIVDEYGAKAERMMIILEGEVEVRLGNSFDNRIYIAAPAVGGVLPFSRMTTNSAMIVATKPSTLLLIHKDQFMPMLNAIPTLGPRLVGLMTDRAREFTRLDLRQEKLMLLGKLSAELAHEFNNPASAAKRSAAGLLESFGDLERAAAGVGEKLGLAALENLLAYLQTLQPKPLSAVARADLEEQIGNWLQARGNPQAWDWAATWVEAGASLEWLEGLHHLKTGIAEEAMPEVLAWLETSIRVRSLAGAVQESTERISALVKAIKSYTYMDQAPQQAIDVRAGLDNTLAIFGHKLKKGITLERDYDPNLPKLEGNGAELNQVWTNLIDNAIDAMNGSGTLRIRAAKEGEQIVVEIGDTGPGIPAEMKAKIFDPFFTTKEAGQGTGLGLDTVRRIVEQHRGNIHLESKPGDTRFQVRLPMGKTQTAQP